MQLRENIFQRSLSKLASSIFCCGSSKEKKGDEDRYYTKFCDEWQGVKGKRKMKGTEQEEDQRRKASRHGSSRIFSDSPSKASGTNRCSASKRYENIDGGSPLGRKMKELEMMGANDMEHVLDVEEALHYYSRLSSPVYLDLVDKFFTDMYTEFSTPPISSTASITASKRRNGSMRLS